MARLYTINTKRYDFVEIDSAVITSYIVTESDHNKWLKIDTTSSSVNLNLPNNLSDGLRFVVENTGNTTVNYVNAVGTSIATQQDPFTEDQYRTVEAVFNAPTSEWRIQGFVGRNDISSLYDVNTQAGGGPLAGNVLEFDSSVWSTGKLPPYTPGSIEAIDLILEDDDHGQVIPIDTTALPVDVAINTGLEAGFYCRVINIGTGNVTFTPAVTLNSPVVSLTGQYDYADIWHAGLEQYYLVTNTGGGAGGTAYVDVSSTGTVPAAGSAEAIAIGAGAAVGTSSSSSIAIGLNSDVANSSANSIAIGPTSSATGTSGTAVGFNSSTDASGVAVGINTIAGSASIAIGASADATVSGSAQIGGGTNATTNTLQYGASNFVHSTFGIKANTGASNPVGAGLEAGTLFLNTSSTQLNYYNGTSWEPAAASPYLSYDDTTFGVTPTDSGGDGNLLLGGNTTAAAFDHQIIIGADADGASVGNIVVGVAADGVGDYSVVLGHTAETNANHAIAIGRNSDGLAADSIAIGANSIVSAPGTNAVQLGAGTNGTANTVQYLTAPIAGANGVIIKTTSGAPVAPAEIGTANFDPNTDILYIYNGTAWVSTTLT